MVVEVVVVVVVVVILILQTIVLYHILLVTRYIENNGHNTYLSALEFGCKG